MIVEYFLLSKLNWQILVSNYRIWLLCLIRFCIHSVPGGWK